MEQNEAIQRLQSAVAELIEAARGVREGAAPETICDAIIHEHRTHQQQFMGTLKLAILAYSRQHCDLRNEAAVQWAQKVAELPNSDLRFPYL